MIIDVSRADVVAVYRALVGVVTPRPIAWVTTIDVGRVNLAPFSFFNAFGATIHRSSSSRRPCDATGARKILSRT